MDGKTFRLEELDSAFWSKVILINIWPSSGLGGFGCMWLVTSDKKEFIIDFETFPSSQKDLENFTPILKHKEEIIDYAHPYAVEGNGWTYLSKERTLIRDDFLEDFMKVYDYYTKHLSERGLATRHMPTIAGYALGIGGEPERFNEEKSYLLWQNREHEAKKRDDIRKSIALTNSDFVWQKLYANNNPLNPELGEYALIFKNVEEKIIGYKFTILYQRKEIAPLHYLGHSSPIECYVLLEERYDDVQGPLNLSYSPQDEKYPYAFDKCKTIDNDSANNYGKFIRAFKTMEEAKIYALEVANKRNYANKWNIVTRTDSKDIMYKNWLRKYEGILSFRKYYKEILDIVCNYQILEHSATGGRDIMDELKSKLSLDELLLKEIRQYIPLILSPKSQEKARDIVTECRRYLNSEDI